MPTDRNYTLVLGAGGLKGLAHIGVLAALEEHDFLPRDVVGCSIGAIVAAAWCVGMSAAELRTMALELRRRDLFRIAHADMALKRMRSPALYRPEPLESFVSGLLGDITFRELERPLLVNTVNLNSGAQVFWGSPGLDDIPVADAVVASCALPGFLPPKEIHGRFFVDGATVSNLPVRVAAARNRDLVIAVDVGSSDVVRVDMQEAGFAAVYARAIEIHIQTRRTIALEQWTTPPLLLLQPRVEHVAGFAAVYARAIEIHIQTRRTIALEQWTTPPLLLLQPRVEHVPLLTFRHSQELIDKGYAAAAAALQEPNTIPSTDQVGVFPKKRFTVKVDRDRCIGCGGCLIHAPRGLFELDENGKAVVTQPEQYWSPLDGGFIRHCPTYAIMARPVGNGANSAIDNSNTTKT